MGPLILYGSQAGNAQDIAEKVLRQSHKFPNLPPCRLSACDTFSFRQLPQEPFVVIVCSTTGQGDPPDNMARFWRFLMRKDLPIGSLKGVQFAVLGLGDSSYQKYNFVAKKLFRRLSQLGGDPLVPLGLCDDQHDLGMDGALITWLPDLWTSLLTKCGVDTQGESITLAWLDDWSKFKSTDIPSKYSVTLDASTPPPPSSTSLPHCPQGLTTHIIANTRVTGQQHFQETRFLRIARPPSLTPYLPGWVLHVLPHNSSEDIETFLSLISLPASTHITVSPRDPNFPPPALPSPCTLEWLAKHYFDLNAVPRRSHFELMAIRSADPTERDRLSELSSAEGLDDLLAYCIRPRRTTLEVMQDFPQTTAKLSLDDWFELVGPIKSRAFSLASSPAVHTDELHLLVAVVRYKTKIAKQRRGLCSTYLADLQPNDPIIVWTAPGTVTFPSDVLTPVIMVGPGTGVAPFRSFIHQRLAPQSVPMDTGVPFNSLRIRDEGASTDSVVRSRGDTVLFFGCRYRAQDFYFESEFSDLVNAGHLQLYTAFSRDTPGLPDTGYVQKRIEEQGDLIWRLLLTPAAHLEAGLWRRAVFFVAGSAKSMPDCVRDAVKSIAMARGSMTDEEAEQCLVRLEQSRHYQTETWS